MYSHTQTLSRHSDKIPIDGQVCLSRRLIANSVKLWEANTVATGPLRCNNMVAWGENCLNVCYNLWYGLGPLLLFLWPAEHKKFICIANFTLLLSNIGKLYLLEYFKSVFLEIQNVAVWLVFLNQVIFSARNSAF